MDYLSSSVTAKFRDKEIYVNFILEFSSILRKEVQNVRIIEILVVND